MVIPMYIPNPRIIGDMSIRSGRVRVTMKESVVLKPCSLIIGANTNCESRWPVSSILTVRVCTQTMGGLCQTLSSKHYRDAISRFTVTVLRRAHSVTLMILLTDL